MTIVKIDPCHTDDGTVGCRLMALQTADVVPAVVPLLVHPAARPNRMVGVIAFILPKLVTVCAHANPTKTRK